LRRLLALALLCTACTNNDRAAPDSTNFQAPESHGPDALLLRIPRAGGIGRVYVYPKLDSVVWTVDEAPSLERVLAFDPDAGTIAYVDSKGFPGRLDLRETDVVRASRAKLTSLASANGSDIYGINSKGEIVRLNPTGGDWHFKPPIPARSVFTQPNGELLIAANKGSQTVLWKVRPPDDVAQDSAVLPLSGRAVRTQVGDRIYFSVDSGLVGVKAKDLSPAGTVELPGMVRALAPTPSGDRVYIATAGDSSIFVVDRYSGNVGKAVTLPGAPIDLRMDGLGRYLLARFPKGDSAWVIAIGTNRLVGAVGTRWEADLPAITPDAELAALGAKDVTLIDPDNLAVKSTVEGGARDFWYFFAWNGFRPRPEGLDQPVTFPSESVYFDTTASSTPDGSPLSPIARDTSPTVVVPGNPVTTGFTVSFAALLDAQKAQQLAGTIVVNGTPAHLVATNSAGSPIYRVVLGPYATRDEADRVGRASRRQYWVFEGSP